MNRRNCHKFFGFLLLALFLCGLTYEEVFAAPRHRATSTDVRVNEVEFGSYAELAAWLDNWVQQNPENAAEALAAIDQLQEPGTAGDDFSMYTACKNVTLTPASIIATKPFRFKVYQIVIDVTIGDCGSIICSTMGFDMSWNPGPNGGATLLGPFPSQTAYQVCVGNSISSRGFLILKPEVPNGSYSIKIKVGGFASADYYNLPVTVN